MINTTRPILNLDLDLLRTFVAVADLNTFAAAAAAVCRTQSAVSQQMQRLEQLVGKELFARHGRNKLLTEQGIQLLGYARKILRFNDEACMSLMYGSLQGGLTIGASEETADTILPFFIKPHRLLLSQNDAGDQSASPCRHHGDAGRGAGGSGADHPSASRLYLFHPENVTDPLVLCGGICAGEGGVDPSDLARGAWSLPPGYYCRAGGGPRPMASGPWRDVSLRGESSGQSRAGRHRATRRNDEPRFARGWHQRWIAWPAGYPVCGQLQSADGERAAAGDFSVTESGERPLANGAGTYSARGR